MSRLERAARPSRELSRCRGGASLLGPSVGAPRRGGERTLTLTPQGGPPRWLLDEEGHAEVVLAANVHDLLSAVRAGRRSVPRSGGRGSRRSRASNSTAFQPTPTPRRSRPASHHRPQRMVSALYSPQVTTEEGERAMSVILGTGGYRFEVVDRWATLPGLRSRQELVEVD